MKGWKMILVVLLLGLALSVTGCGISEPASCTDEPPAPPDSYAAGSVGEASTAAPSSADTISFQDMVVYQGSLYMPSGTLISPGAEASLLGEKLGHTYGIQDFGTKRLSEIEIASTIGPTDLYTVKGYGPHFRLMSYSMANGQLVTARLYECAGPLSKGGDLFDLLRLERRVERLSWQPYEPSGDPNDVDLTFSATKAELRDFLQGLDDAIPVQAEALPDRQLLDHKDQKLLRLELTDQTIVTLRMFPGGYVWYAPNFPFFRIEEGRFERMWSLMHQAEPAEAVEAVEAATR